ncbi:MAG: hypothetical protein IJQ15_04095 [Synergistaceae bacterium]|nr:hypothetical protein [Synergistaceae bacterium]
MFKRILLTLMLMFTVPAYAEFVPSQPIIQVRELQPGMTGHMLTVLKGTKPTKIPVRIVSIIPQKPDKQFANLVLIKILGGHKLAQGMSGSPVYIKGRLAGAIRSGWRDTDHTLGAMMPIEYMCKIPDADTHAPQFASINSITVSGLSANTPAMSELSRKLGVTFTQGMNAGSGTMSEGTVTVNPGDNIAVMLVWGDVELAAFGTVTATDNHGRFLAFGHDFAKRGNVLYPSAGAYVYDVVDSTSFPFKIYSTLGINGTITQDRETGVAGRLGYYAPSVSGEFVFSDLDRKTEEKYRFRTIMDEFATDEIVEAVCKGLAEELWGRKGQGTMSVNLRIDGKNLPNGWARKDIFYSEENIINEAFKQLKLIVSAYLTQPFNETMPVGFSVKVEATQNPRVLLIEDVEAPEDAKPGEEIEVSVKLRGWRTDPVTRKFKLTIPEDASGVVELIVRGGGTQSFGQAGVEGGWKSITSLERMLSEFKAADSNNQLILELNADRTGDLVRKIQNARKKGAKSKSKSEREPDLLPEEEEYLSETKERRIKEGTLKIYSSDYYVDGLMRRVIHTEK